MRKYNIAAIAVLALSLIFCLIFWSVKTYQGEKVSAPYTRFTKSEGTDTSFNWWSIIFMGQIESQKIIQDTVHFTHRIQYPLAPKFKLIEPQDKNAELLVATKIANVIRDSVKSSRHRTWFNPDGNNLFVHNYAHPKVLEAETETVLSSMTGTASPEAGKYGFIKSIQPGHLENENKVLANNRLSRTRNIVVKLLNEYGITLTKKPELHAREVQLTPQQVDSVAKGHTEILDRMRYVDSEVYIITERPVITTLALPILLPLWIWLIGFLLTRNYRRSPITAATGRKAIEPIDRMEDPTKFSWVDLLKILAIIAGIVLIAIFWEYLMWIIYGILALAFIALIWWLRRELGELIKDFFLWIWDGILWIYAGILRIIHWIRRHWPPKSRPECRRVVIALLISLLLNLIFLINWLFF